MRLYTKDGFAEDTWANREVLTLADWLGRRGGGALPDRLAVKLDPGVEIETIGSDHAGIALIQIAFPKFTDGRGYSMGWLLRTRYGYTGEMRAVGDVLFDELQFMIRCGFDSFEIVDEATLRLLAEGRQVAFDRFYQPGLEPEILVGTRPWARRAAAQSGNRG